MALTIPAPPSPTDSDEPKLIGGVQAEFAAEGTYTMPTRGEQFNALYGREARAEKDRALAAGVEWVPDLRTEPPPPAFTYHEGDERRDFARMSTESRFRIQKLLVDSGLLSTEFAAGVWDAPSRTAMKQAMAYGNQWGAPWQIVLRDLTAAPKVNGDSGTEAKFTRGRYVAGEFVQDPFLPEDTDTLTQRIKQQFRQVLGRDPDEGEIGRYVAGLAVAERQSYQRNVASAQSQFGAQEDARRRQFAGSEDERSRQFYEAEGQRVGTPGFQTRPAVDPNDPNTQGGRGAPVGQPGTFQKVDPIASFVERWERDYAPEINARKRVAEASENRQSLMDTIRSVNAAIARG